jgi:hypothetical protein
MVREKGHASIAERLNRPFGIRPINDGTLILIEQSNIPADQTRRLVVDGWYLMPISPYCAVEWVIMDCYI